MNKPSFQSLHICRKNKKTTQSCLANRCAFRFAQQDAGFSMLELIAVVLMIGILAAIATPSWLAFVSRQRVNKANDAILAALQEAQREAKKNKRNYSVSVKNQDGVPKVAIYLTGSIPPADDQRWKTLGEDMTFKPEQVLLYTNLDNTTANTKASATVNYSQLGSGTITFDYLGSLLSANFGTAGGSSAQVGFKIAVAVPQTGNSTQPSNIRRCVILDTLLGGMRTAKDSDCS